MEILQRYATGAIREMHSYRGSYPPGKESTSSSSQASLSNSSDKMMDDLSHQEAEITPSPEACLPNYPMVDYLPSDFVDQLLEEFKEQDDREVMLATDGLERSVGDEAPRNDPPSLPLSPLPLDEDDGYNIIHDSVQDEDSSEATSHEDESVLTQISIVSHTPPPILHTTKCDCEGCNLEESCGACSQCKVFHGMCSCACCTFSNLDQIQLALVELNSARIFHTPTFQVNDMITCRRARCIKWYPGRIYSIGGGKSITYNVRFQDGSRARDVGFDRLRDEFTSRLIDHIDRLEERCLSLKATAVSKLSLTRPASKRSSSIRTRNGTKKKAVETSDRCRKRQKVTKPAMKEFRSRLSTTTGLNDRVLAPYETDTGTYLYWGLVTKVPEEGDPDQTFHVWFDDDDYRVDLRSFELMSEADVQREIPKRLLDFRRNDWTQPKVRSLEELYEKACGHCSQCIAEVCGNCRSCRWNRDNPNSNRIQACLLRLCSNDRAGGKAQPMPALFPNSWRFYFTKQARTCSYELCFCGELKNVGLSIKRGQRRWSCLTETLHASGFSGPQTLKAIEEFYSEVLGMPFDRSCKNHPLLNQAWSQKWIDAAWQQQVVHGTIVGCKGVVDFARQGGLRRIFTVELDTARGAECPATGRRLLRSKIINEDEARGGVIAAKQAKDPTIRISYSDCSHPLCLWRTPTDVTAKFDESNHLSSLHYLYAGYRFELFVKDSDTSNAGKGLFLKCFAVDQTDVRRTIKFRPGEYLDLGVYGPQRNEDIIPRLRHNIKSFLFDGKPESWAFDPHSSEKSDSVFDITDDFTGEIHDRAKRSMIVFANETDGEELPALIAEYDSTGAIHYLLGRKGTEPLTLPVGGDEIELKVCLCFLFETTNNPLQINYGESYELCRVKRGYPRVTGRELLEYRKVVEDEVLDFQLEFEAYSPEENMESLEYIVRFRDLDSGSIKDETYRRLLLLAIVGRRKMEHQLGLCRQARVGRFLSNVDSTESEDPLLIGINQLIEQLCDRFANNPSLLKEEILALNELNQTVMSLFCCGDVQVQDIEGEDLFDVIDMTKKHN